MNTPVTSAEYATALIYNAALLAGEKTRDLNGTLGTREFADAVIARLK